MTTGAFRHHRGCRVLRALLLLTAAGSWGPCAHAQVVYFAPLLRAQFVAQEPRTMGWGLELGIADSGATYWGGLRYSLLQGDQPYPSSGFVIDDSYRRAGIAGGLSSPLTGSLTTDYGLHVDYAWIHRGIVGSPLSWIGTRTATVLAFGLTGRVRYALSDGLGFYAGMDAGYQLLLDQQIETYSFGDRPLHDEFYMSVLGGLWFRLQAGESSGY